MWPFNIFRKKHEEAKEKTRAEARADMDRIERAIDREVEKRIRNLRLADLDQQVRRAAQAGGGKGGTTGSPGRRQSRAVDETNDWITNPISDSDSPRGGACHGGSDYGSSGSHSSSSCDSSSSDSGSSSSSSD